jgi:hypothetical protein
MIPVGSNYQVEGFLYLDNGTIKLKKDATHIKSLFNVSKNQRQSSCLVSMDADTSPSLQSMLSGSNFTFEEYRTGVINRNNRMYSHALKNTGSEGY